MNRATKPYNQIKQMLGNTSTAWELLVGKIRYDYIVDEKWAEGKPTHKNRNNLFVRCSSKPLIILSVREGYFLASVTLGRDERERFDAQRGSFSDVTLREYDEAETLHDGKWLGFEIHDESLVDDIIRLVQVKRKPNRKIQPNNSYEKCGCLDLGLSREEITKEVEADCNNTCT